MVSTARTLATPGKTRVCPHCKSVILDSADICPACQHHLRFGPKSERRTVQRHSAFHVEGTIRQVFDPQTCEYTVVVVIRDGQGHEIKRQVIDVGAMASDELRKFDLTVEVSPPRKPGT
jgi:hypothetical protein